MSAQGKALGRAERPRGDGHFVQQDGERPADDSSVPSPKPFEVIEGKPKKNKQTGHLVCTWCGQRFDRRWRLLEHWNHTRCGANRNVNNPTQTKYEDGSD